MTKVTSTFGIVAGFLAKHVVDVARIADSLELVGGALPINGEERARFNALIADVRGASLSIAAAVGKMQEPKPVVIAKADIAKAVEATLPSVIADVIAGKGESDPVRVAIGEAIEAQVEARLSAMLAANAALVAGTPPQGAAS